MIAELLAITPVIIGLLALSGLFSAAETSMTRAMPRAHAPARTRRRPRRRAGQPADQQPRADDRLGPARQQPDQHPELRPGHRGPHRDLQGRRRRGHHHRPDDRADPGLRRGAAQDPRHPQARRRGALAFRAHRDFGFPVRAGGQHRAGLRARHASPVRGQCRCGDRSDRGARGDPRRGRVPPLRRLGRRRRPAHAGRRARPGRHGRGRDHGAPQIDRHARRRARAGRAGPPGAGRAPHPPAALSRRPGEHHRRPARQGPVARYRRRRRRLGRPGRRRPVARSPVHSRHHQAEGPAGRLPQAARAFRPGGR